jgi:hypothetical protein
MQSWQEKAPLCFPVVPLHIGFSVRCGVLGVCALMSLATIVHPVVCAARVTLKPMHKRRSFSIKEILKPRIWPSIWKALWFLASRRPKTAESSMARLALGKKWLQTDFLQSRHAWQTALVSR